MREREREKRRQHAKIPNFVCDNLPAAAAVAGQDDGIAEQGGDSRSCCGYVLYRVVPPPSLYTFGLHKLNTSFHVQKFTFTLETCAYFRRLCTRVLIKEMCSLYIDIFTHYICTYIRMISATV